MGFLSKLKRNGTSENGEPNEKPVIKPSESLASVLSESVPAASLEVIRGNSRFQLPNDKDGNSRYIVATLDVTYIGGLNKRCAKNDPDKGQFIECINCGNIESYVSEEGIANQTFVIIPNKKTMDSLSEFSFLARTEQFARFIPTYVIVDKNGNMEFKQIDAEVDYNWFFDILESKVFVEDAVKDIDNEEINRSESISESSDEKKSEDIANNEIIKSEETKSDEVVQEPKETEKLEKAEELKEAENANTVKETSEKDSVFGAVLAAMGDDVFSDMLSSNSKVKNNTSSADSNVKSNVVNSDGKAKSKTTEKKEQKSVDNKLQENVQDEANMIICPVCDSNMYFGSACPVCGFDLDAPNSNNITEQVAETEQTEEIEDIDVLNAVERLFHAGGLDLEISAEPFDIQFVKENVFEPIPEDRGDGWLDGYVTQMIKNANAELYQLHKSNLFATRNRYLNLITEECELIATAVDINDPANDYARYKQVIIDDTVKKRRSIDDEITKRRLELQQHWDDELRKIQESAAAAAKRQYLEKYSKAHEASLRNIENSLIDDIDIEYSERLAQLNARRRDDAKKRHDLAVTQTLIVIGESYEELLKEEEERRQQLLAEIQEYIDNHRKDEVARNVVLAESQRQKEEATKVAEEYTRKIDELTTQHSVAFDKLKQELNVVYSQKAILENDFNTRMDKESDKYKELKEQYHILMDKYVDIDNQKAKEYENRLNTLRNDKEAAEEHLAHVDIIHNKYNKISIVVWAAIAIAAFSIGAVFGSNFLAGGASNGHYSISFTSPEAETEDAVTETSTLEELDEKESMTDVSINSNSKKNILKNTDAESSTEMTTEKTTQSTTISQTN